MSGDTMIAFASVVLVALVQIAISFIAYGGLRQKVNSQAEAINDLWKHKITKEEGAGFQAQLDRLERNDAECDGKLAGMRDEFNSRIERATLKIDHMEKNRNTTDQIVAAALAKLDASVAAMKESVDRLMVAEQMRAALPLTQPPRTDMNILDRLREAEEIRRMLKGFGQG